MGAPPQKFEDIYHQGAWLRRRVQRLGLSNAAFARKAGVSREALQRFFQQRELRMRRSTMWRILEALGVSSAARELGYFPERASTGPEEEETTGHIMEVLSVGNMMRDLMRKDLLTDGGIPTLAPVATPDFDANVEPYSEVKVPEIPLFDLPLAAGYWMDVPELCEVGERNIDHGLFRVRLRGDSMTPQYKEGMIVEFRCLRADHEGPLEGRDYYVQRSDGTATFKRFVSMDEDSFTFRALNKKKYPKPIVVPRQEVPRMALAVHVVTPIE